jgi:hypothetical protein
VGDLLGCAIPIQQAPMGSVSSLVCVDAVAALDTEQAGETTIGPAGVEVPKRSGVPPSTATTGRIAAMAMYASDAAEGVHRFEAASDVVHKLWDGAQRHLDASAQPS